MAKGSEFSARYGHVAVHMENCMIVFGGKSSREVEHSMHNIWMYNLYTEQWGKHVIPDGEIAPPTTVFSCAATIEGDIFLFGGYNSAEKSYENAVWKLTRKLNKFFAWNQVKAKRKDKMPTRRYGHSGWEYARQLWTFGGFGPSLVDCFNNYGDFSGNTYGENNQLLCFDPSSNSWKNLQTYGTVPGPRSFHASTSIKNKSWTYGGYNSDLRLTYKDLYELDMIPLMWTKIQTVGINSRCRYMCSLNAPTEHLLVSHGGVSSSKQSLNDTCVLHLPSLTWKKYTASTAQYRNSHKAIAVMNSSVIVTGGERFDNMLQMEVYNDVFFVRLEPKTLQQLATQKIHQHRNTLPWKSLPKLLTARFMFPGISA